MHLKYAKMPTIVGQENLKLGDNNEQKRRKKSLLNKKRARSVGFTCGESID